MVAGSAPKSASGSVPASAPAHNEFKPIVEAAEAADAQSSEDEDQDDDQSAAAAVERQNNGEEQVHPIQEIESLCMECQENVSEDVANSKVDEGADFSACTGDDQAAFDGYSVLQGGPDSLR